MIDLIGAWTFDAKVNRFGPTPGEWDWEESLRQQDTQDNFYHAVRVPTHQFRGGSLVKARSFPNLVDRLHPDLMGCGIEAGARGIVTAVRGYFGEKLMVSFEGMDPITCCSDSLESRVGGGESSGVGLLDPSALAPTVALSPDKPAGFWSEPIPSLARSEGLGPDLSYEAICYGFWGLADDDYPRRGHYVRTSLGEVITYNSLEDYARTASYDVFPIRVWSVVVLDEDELPDPRLPEDDSSPTQEGVPSDGALLGCSEGSGRDGPPEGEHVPTQWTCKGCETTWVYDDEDKDWHSTSGRCLVCDPNYRGVGRGGRSIRTTATLGMSALQLATCVVTIHCLEPAEGSPAAAEVARVVAASAVALPGVSQFVTAYLGWRSVGVIDTAASAIDELAYRFGAATNDVAEQAHLAAADAAMWLRVVVNGVALIAAAYVMLKVAALLGFRRRVQPALPPGLGRMNPYGGEGPGAYEPAAPAPSQGSKEASGSRMLLYVREQTASFGGKAAGVNTSVPPQASGQGAGPAERGRATFQMRHASAPPAAKVAASKPQTMTPICVPLAQYLTQARVADLKRNQLALMFRYDGGSTPGEFREVMVEGVHGDKIRGVDLSKRQPREYLLSRISEPRVVPVPEGVEPSPPSPSSQCCWGGLSRRPRRGTPSESVPVDVESLERSLSASNLGSSSLAAAPIATAAPGTGQALSQQPAPKPGSSEFTGPVPVPAPEVVTTAQGVSPFRNCVRVFRNPDIVPAIERTISRAVRADIAQCHFDNVRLIRGLCAALRNGSLCSLRLLLCERSYFRPSSMKQFSQVCALLEWGGRKVTLQTYRQGGGFDQMHWKAGIFVTAKGCEVVQGSFNWTDQGEKNFETIVHTEGELDDDYIKDTKKIFNELWEHERSSVVTALEHSQHMETWRQSNESRKGSRTFG